jgi:hypothetical protein
VLGRSAAAVLASTTLLGAVLAILAASSVVAATPPVPEGGAVRRTAPRGAIGGLVAVAAVMAMIRWPRTRPWIASVGTLAVTAVTAFTVVLIGSFSNFGSGGAVPLPYSIAAAAVVLAGIGLSVWLGLRLRRGQAG